MKLNRVKRRLLFKIGIGLILLFIICFGLFVFEYFGYDEKFRNRGSVLSFVGDLPKSLDIFYRPLTIFRKSKLPLYEIIIDPKDLKELEESIPPGDLLTDEYKKRVPAKFIYNGKTYDVKVGFRGTLWDHWSFNKKSWRVNFKKSDYFNGYSSINLIIPETRGFFSEEINHFRAKRLGLMVPDSRFVQLKVNNKYYGAYWETEHWNAGFLERHQLSPDANLYGEHNPWWKDLFYFTTDWDKYTEDKISLVNNFAEIDLLINLFANEEDDEIFWQKIPQIIDMDNFYRWYTLNTLAGTVHPDSAHNIRLYFNNVIGKFQFFPWDVSQGTEPSVDVNYNILANRILKNPEFLHQRNKILYEYIKDDENLEAELEYYDTIYKESKMAFYKDRTKMYSNFYFDKKSQDRKEMIAIQYRIVQDAFKDQGRQAITFNVSQNLNYDYKNQTSLNLVASLEVMVKSFSDFELIKLEVKPTKDLDQNLKFYLYYDKNKNNILDNNDPKIADLAYSQTKELIESSFIKSSEYSNLYTNRDFANPPFPALPNGEPVDLIPTTHKLFLATEQRNLPSVNLIFQDAEIELANAITEETIKPRLAYVDATTFDYLDQASYDIQTFLVQNSIFRKGIDNEVVLPIGSYNINKTIIIPRGISLKIAAAARLNFATDVSLISYGPITAIGTESNPIIFTAQNINQPWGVVGIVDTEKSIFDNTKFEYGGEAYINGVYFSGMLALHKTDGEITSSQFSNATGDDGVNVKYGKALIKDNYFYNNNFDALDLDFSDSEVINNLFESNGNDSIDISGSQAMIKNNIIRDSGDKGISIGEKSNPIIFNNVITGCNTGIASKDLSEPKIINNVIYQNNEGISLFEKKPIFGAALANVFNTIIWDNEEPIKLDDKSSITIQYSDIDWPGEGNVKIDPEFLSNYLLTDDSELNKLGNTEVLKDIIGIDLTSAPIGLVKELWLK